MALVAGLYVFATDGQRKTAAPSGLAGPNTEISSQSKRGEVYVPTPEQWAMLTVEPVTARVFRSEHVTEGKIAINEDSSTPVFSPNAGRVTRLAAKPGDFVQAGQPLFFIEAADMIQAQNDFMAAVAALNKANSRVTLTEIVERQSRRLVDSKAGSLRELQVAEAELAQARSDVRSAEAALEATRNRLRLLGKTDAEVAEFQEKGRISPETPIHAPIAGTVVQRKVGPGQYVSYTSTGSLDPIYTIGDLSTVWVVAYVRESEAPKVRLGQQMEFSVLAYPDRTLHATVDYIATSLDTGSRRLMVRATIKNEGERLKPEMFASVVVFGEGEGSMVAVPRDAVIFEADRARVWVAREDKAIELRQIRTGMVSGRMIQVLQGLRPGEKIVTKGSIFVDRAATI